MITIAAMAPLMFLSLSSSVSTAGEALQLKLNCSLIDEQSTKPYTNVIIGHDGQQRERERERERKKERERERARLSFVLPVLP